MSDDTPPTFNLFGLRLPVRGAVVIVLSTLLMIVDHYYDFAANVLPEPNFPAKLRNAAYDHVVLYLVIPLLLIVLVFRQRPADYGFRLGDWRAGLKLTLIGWAIAAPVLYLAGRLPEVQAYYQNYFVSPADVMITAVLELVGWEFFFRGFLLWGLWEVAGPGAVLLQAVPFALMHFGKPSLETISTVFTGVAFGWVAWRTRSFLYMFLIHLFISTFIVFVVVALP